MRKLIEAEFYKLSKLHSFHLIFLFALFTGIFRGFSSYPGYQVYILGLFPDLFDAVLVAVFTVAFICMEFSSRTFGNAFLCGISRQNVFLAKLAAYFPGLLILILIPLAVSTSIAATKNGFGADWDTVALEMAVKLLFYIIYRFSMAGSVILTASVIQNSVGTLGISLAGICLMALAQNSAGNPVTQNIFIVSIIKIVIFLSAAIFIFMKRDLK